MDRGACRELLRRRFVMASRPLGAPAIRAGLIVVG